MIAIVYWRLCLPTRCYYGCQSTEKRERKLGLGQLL